MTHYYRHISAEDRAAIMLTRVNHSIRAIARQLMSGRIAGDKARCRWRRVS